MSKVGNPCPTLGQLLASWILYTLLVGEEQHENASWEFPNLVVSNVYALLRSFADLRLRYFALICWKAERCRTAS